jgi:hypothetical protein
LHSETLARRTTWLPNECHLAFQSYIAFAQETRFVMHSLKPSIILVSSAITGRIFGGYRFHRRIDRLFQTLDTCGISGIVTADFADCAHLRMGCRRAIQEFDAL